MAEKDLDTSENKDGIKNGQSGPEEPGKQRSEQTDNEKGIDQSQMKNAHASGTGSIGRNESSLPPEDQENKREETTY